MKRALVFPLVLAALLGACKDDPSSAINGPLLNHNPNHNPGGGQAGTTLSAVKTAEGFFERTITYDWDIAKSVDPAEIEIKPGESGVVTYWISATRTQVSLVDKIGVRGDVCVTNGGERATEGLMIVDQVEFKTGAGQFQDLAGASQTITPDELGAGESACYPYEIEFTPVAGATYRNTSLVTITNHSGSLGTPKGPEPKADFSLPASPTIVEIDAAADVADAQICPTGFVCTGIGSFHFEDSAEEHIAVTVANVSAPCAESFELNNTVTLTEIESGQARTASATVTITTGICPVEVDEGCSPGFWKNHTNAWDPSGFSPGQTVASAGFVLPATFGDGSSGSSLANASLLQALSFQGGKTLNGAAQILLRASVAALLNAAHPDVNYPRNAAAILSDVNAAIDSNHRQTMLNLAAALDADNNLGCPLGG